MVQKWRETREKETGKQAMVTILVKDKNSKDI